MIRVKYSIVICLFLCLHNSAQSSALTQDKEKFGIVSIYHDSLSALASYIPSFWKGSSSASTNSNASDDYDEDLMEWKSSSSKRAVCSQEETDFESEEDALSSFDAWIEPSDNINDDTPLILDTLPVRLFCNLLETSEQRYIHPVVLYPQVIYVHKKPERDIYQQLFFNALRPARYSDPLSVVELYPTPRPRIAATVESFSLLPRDEPNSKAYASFKHAPKIPATVEMMPTASPGKASE